MYIHICIFISRYIAIYMYIYMLYQVHKLADPTNSFPTHAKVFLAYTSQG